MGRSIKVAGIALYARIAPCAHNCCYCLLGDKKLANIPFSRFASLVERFIDWQASGGITNFRIFHWVRFSYDFDIAAMRRWIKLWDRLGRCPDMLLGGLPLRSEAQMRDWLRERKEAGIKEVHASFAGYGEMHDRWNGRAGDFDFQMNNLRIAGELGMEISQRLFLTQSTLPLLEPLIDQLDELPGRVKKRYVCPLFYMGTAVNLENDRITEATRAKLPARIAELCRKNRVKWRSEREWLEVVRNEQEGPEAVMLRLEPDEDNIDKLEAMSCEEIVAALTAKTRRAYEAIPSRRELCEKCGDLHNTRIYTLRNDIERKWLDRYLADNPLSFDRLLTHLAMVQ